MKKVQITLTLFIVSLSIYAQTIPAVNNLAKEFGILKFNPANSATETLATYYGSVQENTMAYDNTLNTILLISNTEKGRSLERISALTGQRINSIALQEITMGGIYLPKSKAFGMFSLTTNFNGYGNNQEDISFVAIDVYTGSVLFKTPFPGISLSAQALPLYANLNLDNPLIDPRIGAQPKQTAISNLEYLSDDNQVIFAARDVTGTNRLYRLDASTGRIISQTAVQHNFLDFAYNSVKKELMALAFEQIDNQIQLYVVKLDLQTLHGLNRTNVFQYDLPVNSMTKIQGSAIEYDLDNNYYITQPSLLRNGQGLANHYLFKLSNNGSEVESLNYFSSNTQFKFGYRAEDLKNLSYFNATKVFPNPSKGNVNIETVGAGFKQVAVFDEEGRLVREIEIQDLPLSAALNLTGLSTGIYTLRIETSGSPVFKKIFIQP